MKSEMFQPFTKQNNQHFTIYIVELKKRKSDFWVFKNVQSLIIYLPKKLKWGQCQIDYQKRFIDYTPPLLYWKVFFKSIQNLFCSILTCILRYLSFQISKELCKQVRLKSNFLFWFSVQTRLSQANCKILELKSGY